MLNVRNSGIVLSLALAQILLLPGHSFAKTPSGSEIDLVINVDDPDVIFSDGLESTAVPVEITSFTALPVSINEGESIELSWRVENATSCTPSNGTGGWDEALIMLPEGSMQLDITTAGSYDFTLTCSGATIDQATSTNTVEVASVTPACDVTLTKGVVRTWDFIFGTDWPAPIYGKTYISIYPGGYFSVAFATGDVVDAGFLGTIEASGSQGGRLGAISETPGCFDVVDECKYYWPFSSGGIIWDTTGDESRCSLKPNTSYYWNITFTDGSDPESSGCADSYCYTYLQVSNPED